MAEALLLAPRGGAVAVLASSSLDCAREQTAFVEAVLAILFEAPGLPLGEVVRRAKIAPGVPAWVARYVLLGDPMTALVEAPASTGSGGWRRRD